MIRIEHLKKSYGESANVLTDVNAVIEKGEVISVIGPSGTGKSTFLRCLNLLERPSGGKIWFDDVEITNPGTDITKIRQKVGMVFQSFNLFDHLSVLDNLMVGPIRLLGMDCIEAERRGRELLAQVGMANRAEYFPYELSGGQKQRVAIARTLSMSPEIILFDEPTSALDPTMVSEVLKVIRDIAQRGITMLIVTHEMKFAQNVSSRIFYMDQGIIYEDGTPEQIFKNPQKELTKVFINRIRAFNYHMEDKNFDRYDLLSKLMQFCVNYGLKGSYIDRIQHIVEESIRLALLDEDGKRDNIIKNNGGLDLKVSYSEENEHTEISLKAPASLGRILDNEADEDGLSSAIIKGMSKKIEEFLAEERQELSIILNC